LGFLARFYRGGARLSDPEKITLDSPGLEVARGLVDSELKFRDEKFGKGCSEKFLGSGKVVPNNSMQIIGEKVHH
jgi:hypothetical protein